MPKNFIEYKRIIDAYLKKYLTERQNSLKLVNNWGEDSIARLMNFAVGGKTVRGGLVLFAIETHGATISDDALLVASALELIHSGLLIHDDIMDKDAMRRGSVSLYAQYEKLAIEDSGKEATHFGISMGINEADLCFFLAYELLGKVIHPQAGAIFSLVSRELSSVVIAQMQDVASGHLPKTLTPDDVLSMYRYKTARYTFSLPLSLGSMLANAEPTIIQKLDEFGEATGMLFQISDDELSETGHTATTGKPTGSDARNKKQTLASLLSQGELATLKSTFSTNAQKAIDSFSLSPEKKTELEALLVFCQNRNK